MRFYEDLMSFLELVPATPLWISSDLTGIFNSGSSLIITSGSISATKRMDILFYHKKKLLTHKTKSSYYHSNMYDQLSIY
jgi:hypothetical protein